MWAQRTLFIPGDDSLNNDDIDNRMELNEERDEGLDAAVESSIDQELSHRYQYESVGEASTRQPP